MDVATLLYDYSLEMTLKDISRLDNEATLLPTRTRINVTHLGKETIDMRAHAATRIAQEDLTPVPHVSARRVASREQLDSLLHSLTSMSHIDNLLVIGGDPSKPVGDYPDALSVIRSSLLTTYNIHRVSVAGYPDGHPDIDDDVLRRAVTEKLYALSDLNVTSSVITQFSFDVDAVVQWIANLRAAGFHMTVRVGIPGPVNMRKMIKYANKLGVQSSAGLVKKYGFSMTNLLGNDVSQQLVTDLAEKLPEDEQVKLHFYTFGEVHNTVEWINQLMV